MATLSSDQTNSAACPAAEPVPLRPEYNRLQTVNCESSLTTWRVALEPLCGCEGRQYLIPACYMSDFSMNISGEPIDFKTLCATRKFTSVPEGEMKIIALLSDTMRADLRALTFTPEARFVHTDGNTYVAESYNMKPGAELPHFQLTLYPSQNAIDDLNGALRFPDVQYNGLTEVSNSPEEPLLTNMVFYLVSYPIVFNRI